MFVKEILREKGHDVFTISSSVTLVEVVDEMMDRQCGSLIVVDEDKMIGIVTERDILRGCSEWQLPMAETRLTDVMRRDVVTASLTDDLTELMGLMTRLRLRHLPVVDEDGELVGIVSIGDVVKAQQVEFQSEKQESQGYVSH